jgi:hypothetical protein
MDSKKTNWWLDAVLFAGFMITFLLDLTGIELHQWIGVFVGLLVLVHLVRHMEWFCTVLSRFFGRTTASARLNLVMDVGIGTGFILIMLTGLAISTWLNLNFIDYTSWKYIHILTSVFTLFALLFKIVLHRKWIVNVAEKHIFSRRLIPEPVPVGLPPQASAQVNRREFLKVSALLGAGTIVGITHIHKILEEIVTEKISSSSAVVSGEVISREQTVDTAASQPTPIPAAEVAIDRQSTTACSVLCPRGCSFPGRCRKYVDSNGNGKCDRGECL